MARQHVRSPHQKTQQVARPASSSTTSSTWQGRQTSEHVANQHDDLNAHSAASKAGKEDRADAEKEAQPGDVSQDVKETGGRSQAATQRDHNKANEAAKKDFPEAPGPVIGMNDERGGVSFLPRKILVSVKEHVNTVQHLSPDLLQKVSRLTIEIGIGWKVIEGNRDSK